jgi:hypothetical protein
MSVVPPLAALNVNIWAVTPSAITKIVSLTHESILYIFAVTRIA